MTGIDAHLAPSTAPTSPGHTKPEVFAGLSDADRAWVELRRWNEGKGKASALFRLLRRPGTAIPGAVLLLVVLTCGFLPLVGVLPNPTTGHLSAALLPIGARGHLLGTNQYGNDELSRLVYGGRVSIVVGAVSTVVGGGIGVLLGIVAGYWGRWADTVVARLLDVLLAFPGLILALAIAAYLGPSELHTIYAISVFGVAGFGRIARAEVMRMREREFVVAAKVSGRPSSRIIAEHVVQNILPAIMAFALFAFGLAIVAESALSYLGLSVQSPQPSWGNMIADGQSELSNAPWLVLLPSAMLFVTVLSTNLLADGLREGRRVRAAAGT